MTEAKKVNIVSPPNEAEIIKAVEDAASYAKRLFLEGAVPEAVKLAEHAKQLIANIDTAAASDLSAMASRFRAFLQGPAPASSSGSST